jgi:hypothetical protein
MVPQIPRYRSSLTGKINNNFWITRIPHAFPHPCQKYKSKDDGNIRPMLSYRSFCLESG